uniref:hypothetical protein n=1 Tax=Flavobacterium sp. TaxID=239 RepID=UPI0040488DFC
MKIKFISLLTVLTLNSCNNNNLSNKKETDKEEWTKVITETKTVNNITYFFSSDVNIQRRNAAIEECQNSIEENLKLIEEAEFNNKMDIEFFKI